MGSRLLSRFPYWTAVDSQQRCLQPNKAWVLSKSQHAGIGCCHLTATHSSTVLTVAVLVGQLFWDNSRGLCICVCAHQTHSLLLWPHPTSHLSCLIQQHWFWYTVNLDFAGSDESCICWVQAWGQVVNLPWHLLKWGTSRCCVSSQFHPGGSKVRGPAGIPGDQLFLRQSEELV